jgi:hypothetical protein
MRRAAAGAAPAAAIVVFVVQIGRWQYECNAGINCGDGPAHFILAIGRIALVVGAAALLVWLLAAAVMNLVRRRAVRVVPTTTALAASGALGLLAAAPVTESWYDGCNSTVARMPAIASVQLWRGDLDPVAYDAISTSMLCS